MKSMNKLNNNGEFCWPGVTQLCPGVGATFEAVDPVFRFAHGGQQEDRDGISFPQTAGQRQSTFPRHHQIEDEQIELDAQELLARVGGAFGRGDAESAIGQKFL